MHKHHFIRFGWIAAASFLGTLAGLFAVWIALHLPALEPLTLPPMPPWISPERLHPAAHIDLHEQVSINQRIESIERRLEREYGIEIEMNDDAGLHEQFGVDAVPYPLSSRAQHLQAFAGWLAKYPPVFIRSSGLRKIYLMKGWEHQGVDMGGVLLDRDVIGTMAEEATFHHEIFHIFDENDGGVSSDDGDWMREKYGRLRTDIYDNANALSVIGHGMHQSERPAGFVNAYGMFGGVEEDQATVAEALLTRHAQIMKLAVDDEELKSAVTWMKRFFYSRSNGRMDALFWQAIDSGVTFDDGYWAAREERQDFVVEPSFDDARESYLRIQHARKQLDDGESAEGEEMFRLVIGNNPHDTAFVRELGAYYEREGRYSDAIELYQQAQVHQAQNRLDVLIARDFAEMREWEWAVHHYRIAFEKGLLDAGGMREFADAYRAHVAALRAAGHDARADAAEAAMEDLLGIGW